MGTVYIFPSAWAQQLQWLNEGDSGAKHNSWLPLPSLDQITTTLTGAAQIRTILAGADNKYRHWS